MPDNFIISSFSFSLLRCPHFPKVASKRSRLKVLHQIGINIALTAVKQLLQNKKLFSLPLISLVHRFFYHFPSDSHGNIVKTHLIRS